jgi:heat shock protein 1/8
VSIKHTLNDQNVQGKISESDKQTVLNKVNEVESWISSHESGETAEYEAKQKELERLFNPIISRVYQGNPGAAAGAGCGNFQGSQAQSGPGPNVDEVD